MNARVHCSKRVRSSPAASASTSLAAKNGREQRDLSVRIAKNIDEIKGAFADQAFGIDGEPPPRSKVQDVAVVDVAVKHDDVWRFGD